MRKALLKQKIASLVIWTGLLSALLISGTVFLYLSRFFSSNQQEGIISETTGHAQQTALVFKNNQIFAKMLGTRTRVKEFMLDRSEARRVELLKIFADYVKEDKKYLAIFLMDKDGLTLISTDERFTGNNYGFRNYFKQALAGQPTVEAAMGKTSKEFGYYFSHPVLAENGAVLGVLVVKVSTSDIDDYLLSGRVAENGTVMLTNEFGVILASNNSERILKSLGPLTVPEQTAIDQNESFLDKKITALQYGAVQEIIRNYTGAHVIQIYDEEDRDRETLSVAKVPGLPFYLVVENRLSGVTGQAIVTVAIIFVVILAGLIVELIVIYYFLSVFLRPLKKLQGFSQSIGKGDFTQKIDIKTNDEFGELAESFNKMGKNLDDLYKNLDEKVREKTRDVDKKAKQLAEQKSAILNVLEDAETQKERAEDLVKDLEKFKLATEDASDHIVIADQDGTILFANKAVEEITGFKPSEVVGKKVGTKELWGGEMDKAFYQNLWKTVKIDKKPFSGELHNHRKNGEKYIAKASISPILNRAGEVVFFVAIERDITKEKMIDKAKSEFVSLASHQLRTPLSAIKWTLEALSQDEGLTAKHKERVKDVYDSNERLIALVNDLLNVAHIEEGKVVAKRESSDIAKLIDESLKVLKVNADKKKQTLKLIINAPITQVELDILRFGEAFNNLVSNAINYAPAGEQITITVSVKDSNYLIAVHNDKPVIPLSDQTKLFTKFYRGVDSQAIKTTGSGLGLFIAKAAVEQNGGKIWFESKEGAGTTFFFTVPKK